ncbi:hypothetical protein GIB67_004281 [Kingdonia uniflora]|uniref:Uncharacterized protein n=1 Tax=Kingdonia uniflora TaxID=39325 RepID=A0A7J7MR34_9MAGN|nr:hypothetical protein GIB67_004281 [Kingdonia uniflora]
MPGPGPHTMYAMTTGTALMALSNGKFSPHHILFYTVNAFLGPDLGSFSEWLTSTLGLAQSFGSLVMDTIHHPFYYIFILGLPLCVFYNWVSKILIQKGLLSSVSGVPLSRLQCLLLVSAGSLSHFFLDHLFEEAVEDYGSVYCEMVRHFDVMLIELENGHSSMYTWILSTGWWKGRAPVNPDAVIVVGFLCTCLIGGFVYINRVNPTKSIRVHSSQSMKLILIIASLYCLWCASQIYWRNPPQPAVGEEADLGVIVFLAVYFFLPHSFCIISMNSKDSLHTEELLPL